MNSFCAEERRDFTSLLEEKAKKGDMSLLSDLVSNGYHLNINSKTHIGARHGVFLASLSVASSKPDIPVIPSVVILSDRYVGYSHRDVLRMSMMKENEKDIYFDEHGKERFFDIVRPMGFIDVPILFKHTLPMACVSSVSFHHNQIYLYLEHEYTKQKTYKICLSDISMFIQKQREAVSVPEKDKISILSDVFFRYMYLGIFTYENMKDKISNIDEIMDNISKLKKNYPYCMEL